MSGPVIVGLVRPIMLVSSLDAQHGFGMLALFRFRIRRRSYIAFSSPCGLVTRRFVSSISRIAGLTTFGRAIQNEVDRPLCKLSEILFLYARKSGPSG
jgi:hypothetical protein